MNGLPVWQDVEGNRLEGLQSNIIKSNGFETGNATTADYHLKTAGTRKFGKHETEQKIGNWA